MPILSIRHRGLRRFWERGDASKLPAEQIARLRRRLSLLDGAQSLEALRAIQSLRLNALSGVDRYSIWVNGNWRLTFEWIDGAVHLLDFEDYH